MDWPGSAGGVCRAPLTWSSLESATSKTLESLAATAGNGGDAELEAPAEVSRSQLLADAADLLCHLEAGRGMGFWMFAQGVVKRCAYLWRNTRFGGRRCDSPPVLRSLISHLREREQFDRAWQNGAASLSLPGAPCAIAWLASNTAAMS